MVSLMDVGMNATQKSLRERNPWNRNRAVVERRRFFVAYFLTCDVRMAGTPFLRHFLHELIPV